MEQNLPNPTLSSLNQAKDYIYSIDFSNIINKMVAHQGWNKSDAEAVCQLYRNFLYLSRKYSTAEDNQLPPSEDVDEFWHNHILDTIQYKKDCNVIFGRYLEHYPYFGIDGKSDMNDLKNAFDTMQELHQQEFGSPIYEIRGKFAKLKACIKSLFK